MMDVLVISCILTITEQLPPFSTNTLAVRCSTQIASPLHRSRFNQLMEDVLRALNNLSCTTHQCNSTCLLHTHFFFPSYYLDFQYHDVEKLFMKATGYSTSVVFALWCKPRVKCNICRQGCPFYSIGVSVLNDSLYTALIKLISSQNNKMPICEVVGFKIWLTMEFTAAWSSLIQ